MVNRRAQRLLDFGAALGLVVAGWFGGHQKVAAAESAETSTLASVRVELAPLRADMARISALTTDVYRRVGTLEGRVAVLSSSTTTTEAP